ncbi:alpha/beta family hydrolase [Micromonospora sp. NPDC004551]|uniref:alpha/beta hydrolase family protein n=1 Tax=Micromonospora sp. NPDC004551 TaxID=3154284 RepID=UPI0033BD115F
MRHSDEIGTPRGPARIHADLPAAGTTVLVLGHGAGGDVDAPDLVAVRDALVGAGAGVVRVTQPYRVAGRRAPAPAGHLDEAWTVVLAELRARHPEAARWVVGGRSSGARVACRTAHAVGAAGIVALAFPLHPPGRPERSRADELRTCLPTLVVNGDRDPFGVPEPAAGVEVVTRPGERHDLRGDPAATAAVVRDWLRARGWVPA